MAIDAYQGGEQTRIGLRLVALTFVRTSEWIKAQWREIDFDKALWTIPAERMKKRREHLVPLPRQCLELLKELEALNDDSDYLFPSRNRTEHMADNTLLAALYRAGYRGKMSGHGFRSVFKTSMSELRSLGQHSFSREAVNLQMAHKRKDKLEEAYDRAELLPERTAMMQWWADHLDRLSVNNYN
jgi:integrase